MFWQRSNYFIVLMTALGVGVFAIKDPIYALCLSIFAAISSWYWYKTNLGSKFWQESWEAEVVNLAKEHNIRSFERPTPEIIEQVRISLEQAWVLSGKGIVRRFLDVRIVKKPSVSHYMILLSLTSVALWTLVSVMYIFDILTESDVENQGDHAKAGELETRPKQIYRRSHSQTNAPVPTGAPPAAVASPAVVPTTEESKVQLQPAS